MNYPLRNGILSFLLDGDAEFLADTLKEIYATYPRSVCNCLMNLLGTHDTERILTVLGEGNERNPDESNDVLAYQRLDARKLQRGISLLKIAAAIQYTVYGVPSVFYGDEAGLEGYHDPFCRRPYPWGKENRELLEFYKILGKIRKEHSVFSDGDFRVTFAQDAVLAYVRENCTEKITVIANMNDEPMEYHQDMPSVDLLNGNRYEGSVAPHDVCILFTKKQKEQNNNGISSEYV